MGMFDVDKSPMLTGAQMGAIGAREVGNLLAPGIKRMTGYESPKRKAMAIAESTDLSSMESINNSYRKMQQINPAAASAWLKDVMSTYNAETQRRATMGTSKPNTAADKHRRNQMASALQSNFDMTTTAGRAKFIQTATKMGLGDTSVVQNSATNLTTMQAGERQENKELRIAKEKLVAAEQKVKDALSGLTLDRATAQDMVNNLLLGTDSAGRDLRPDGTSPGDKKKTFEIKANAIASALLQYQKKLKAEKYKNVAMPKDISKFITPMIQNMKDIYDSGVRDWDTFNEDPKFNVNNLYDYLDKMLGIDGKKLSDKERADLIAAGVPIPSVSPVTTPVSEIDLRIQSLIKKGDTATLRKEVEEGLYTKEDVNRMRGK